MKKCCACNNLESDYETNCSVCGSPLIPVPGDKEKPVISVGTPRPQKNVQMVKKCINCDNIEELDKIHCTCCGGDLRSVPKTAQSASPQKKVQMVKKCANCDHIEQPGKTQCSRCGGYLLSVPKNSDDAQRAVDLSQTCPKCGSVNHGGRSKCIHCGNELEVPKIAPRNQKSYSLDEAHGICVAVALVWTVFCIILAFCCLNCISEDPKEFPSFYPFSVIAPMVEDFYHRAYTTETMVLFNFSIWASIAIGITSVVFFVGLVMRKRWAGQHIGVPLLSGILLLVTMDMMRVMLPDVREPSFFDADSGGIWLFTVFVVLIDWAVSAYYRKRLDSMDDT